MKESMIYIRKQFILPLFLLVWQSVFSQDLENINFKKPVKLHGNINLQFEYYKADQIDPRKKDFSWLISGNPTLELGGIRVPFSFLLSNFENKFYQPFNQFGISPYYKWAKLHLGYRNITYSPYTLAGHQMLGAGFDLTPGNFRVGFMYGRLRRSAAIDSALNANPLAIRPEPTFSRFGMGTKVGYGTQKNYIDLIYFQGWDKDKSLSSKLQDSIQPAENKTLGVSTKVMPTKNLTWQVNVGLSSYTVNKYDEKDTSGLPGKNEWIQKLMSPFVMDKLSTRYYLAGETSLGYQMPKWTTGIMYKRIDPGYQSMGAYFFQSDLQEFTFTNQFRLDSGRLNISANVGLQQDNLEQQKTSTSRRFIGSANISYVPSVRYGITFNYSNYGITNNPLVTSPGDELFKQVSNSVMLMPFFNWMNERTAKNLNFILMFQSLSTPQSSIGSIPTLNTYSSTVSFNHTWIQKGFNANGTANYILSKTPQGDVGSLGGSIGGMLPLLERKLTVNASGTYLNNTFDNKANGHTIRGTLGLTMAAGEHHSFQLLGSYLNNESINATLIQSFNELSVQLIYGLSF